MHRFVKRSRPSRAPRMPSACKSHGAFSAHAPRAPRATPSVRLPRASSPRRVQTGGWVRSAVALTAARAALRGRLVLGLPWAGETRLLPGAVSKGMRLVVVAIALGGIAPRVAVAAHFTVTSAADGAGACAADCTLREAIAAANAAAGPDQV